MMIRTIPGGEPSAIAVRLNGQHRAGAFGWHWRQRVVHPEIAAAIETREAIAETVEHDQDVDDELRYLLTVVGRQA